MLNRAMQNAQLAALFALGGIVGAPPAMAQDYDADGCWRQVPQGCLDADLEWDEDSDTVTITTVTNTCGSRIFLELCIETENDDGINWRCQYRGLPGGASFKQTTFFSTGGIKWHFIGSRSSATDATCRAKAGMSGG